MFNRDENPSFKEVETIIGPSVKVEGNFIGSGDVIVEGTVSGLLKTAKNLKVGDRAKIKADIEAENVFTSGEIRGNMKIRGKLEMKASAKIYGNVETNVLSVEPGAILNGKCMMGQKNEIQTFPQEEERKEEKKNKK
jgi:cytoskeletal protein CcmA (bactofilin family)